MLKPTVKKRWVRALRGGEYRQGQGSLHLTVDNSYCCLGVLCDTEDRANASSWRGCGALPTSVKELMGLDDMDMRILIEANDDAHWSFTQIADYIEEML